MGSEVSSPLQSIVKRLAGTAVDGPAAKLKRRFTEATNEIVVLADCSGSMTDLVGSSGISKFRHLQIALEDLLEGFPKVRIVAFASYSKEISNPKKLPDPSRGMGLGGGTNLAGALEVAARRKPRKTIVISDGLPDSEVAALEAAERMTGAIDTIYCGPDNHPAVEFLRKLSRQTGGQEVTWDGRNEISGIIRGFLPAPE